jgi:hypothetical protein
MLYTCMYQIKNHLMETIVSKIESNREATIIWHTQNFIKIVDPMRFKHELLLNIEDRWGTYHTEMCQKLSAVSL